MTRTTQPVPSWKGPATFLLLAFGLSWGPALLLRDAWSSMEGAFATELLAASTFYALTMGWQPLAAVWFVRRKVEPPGYVDHGLKPARPSFIALGAFAPLVLAAAAILVAWGAHWLGLLVAPGGSPAAPTSGAPTKEPLAYGFLLPLALLGSLLLVWMQAMAEEVGWRGYFLIRLMQWLGPWRGLLLHGLVWGVWYALPLILATDGLSRAPLHGSTFVMTCVLLGALLGWLRLASRSIIPAVVANSVLTVSAGLPLLLQGAEVGPRGAAYMPFGWLPMAALLAALALGRCRRAIAVPAASGFAGGAAHVWGWGREAADGQRRSHRTLH